MGVLHRTTLTNHSSIPKPHQTPGAPVATASPVTAKLTPMWTAASGSTYLAILPFAYIDMTYHTNQRLLATRSQKNNLKLSSGMSRGEL